MKAVVKTGKGKGLLEWREVAEPKTGPGEVKIRVKAVSVCGSDIHIWHDAHPYWPPMILGHEFSGEIVELGAGVEGWSLGERVVSETRTGACGVCSACQSGAPQVCKLKRPPGIGRDGAFTDFLVMPARLLHKLPANITWEQASMIEPTACCVYGLIERVRLNAGETVVVQGPGPIGLLTAMVAKAAGASKVIVSGTARSAGLKLEKALEIGATRVINVGAEDLEKAVMQETGDVGADIVMECSGNAQAIEQSFQIVKRLGKIGVLGISGKKEGVLVPWDVALFKAPTVTFCFSSSWTAWETVIRMISSGILPVEKLITHREPLTRWHEVMSALEAGRGIKAVLNPGGVLETPK